MRLKKQYLALIIAMMLIVVAVLSSFIYNTVQRDRVAYVSVHADKAAFTSEEDVTFELVPLTKGIQFTVDDQFAEYLGVHVIRIPDLVEPYEVVTNLSMIDKVQSWNRGFSIVHTGTFNSTGEPLQLSWNGTMQVWNDLLGAPTWVNATSGYYILYPSLQFDYGHYARFMLDEGAIFYYESMDTNVTVDWSSASVSVSMDLSLGPGMPEGEYQMVSRLGAYTSMGDNISYINRTFTLSAGGSYPIDIGPIDGSPSTVFLDALIIGPDGELLAFGFHKYDYGGGFIEFQY